MNAPQQDIDSGTGEIITEGEPVDHVDNLDGQSAGHTIEPEGEVHEPGNVVSERPAEASRNEIYDKARTTRDIQDAADAEEQSPEQKAAIARATLEAAGQAPDADDDPYDGEGNLKEGWVDTGAAPAQVVEPSAAPAPAAQIQPATLDADAETVTIVVYGMKQEVPRAEVDAAGGVVNYQKNLAADERMQRLSTYEASLRGYDQQLQERAANLQSPQADAPAAGSELPPTGAQDESVDVQAQAEKLVGAMYTGDREAAITEAAEVLSSINSAAQRTAQASAAAQPEASAQTQADLNAANARDAAAQAERVEANRVFVDEFSDLKSGVLRNATYAMVQTVAAEPVMYGRPLAEITREAGLRVRQDVFGTAAAPAVDPAPTPAPGTPPVDLAGRMELKRRTVVQPLLPTSGRFTDTPADEQKTESNSEYINRMRRESRGQYG